MSLFTESAINLGNRAKHGLVALFAASATLLTACGPSPQEVAARQQKIELDKQTASANAQRAAKQAAQARAAAESAYVEALLRGETPQKPAIIAAPPQATVELQVKSELTPAQAQAIEDCKQGAKNALIGSAVATGAVCIIDVFVSGGIAFCAPMAAKTLTVGGAVVAAGAGCAVAVATTPGKAYGVMVPQIPMAAPAANGAVAAQATP